MPSQGLLLLQCGIFLDSRILIMQHKHKGLGSEVESASEDLLLLFELNVLSLRNKQNIPKVQSVTETIQEKSRSM